MSLDLRALRGFVAIASAGSISRAAERLLTHANEILRHFDVALEDVRGAVAQPTGSVALGLPQSMARYLAVPLVKHVLHRWPAVRLQIVEMNTGYVTESLSRGATDLGMTFGTETGGGIADTHLLDEELVFVSSRRQLERYLPERAPKLESIRLAELRRIPIVLPTTKHSLRRHIDERLDRSRLALDVVAEVNAIPQLIELAAADVASTVLSYAAVSPDVSRHRLVVSRIVAPRLTRPVYLCRANTVPLTIAATMVQERIKALVTEMIQAGDWPTSMRRSATRRTPRGSARRA